MHKAFLRFQRGQAVVEYAVIAGTILLAFVVSIGVTQRLLGASMQNTMQGVSSPKIGP